MTASLTLLALLFAATIAHTFTRPGPASLRYGKAILAGWGLWLAFTFALGALA